MSKTAVNKNRAEVEKTPGILELMEGIWVIMRAGISRTDKIIEVSNNLILM
jgi:hypothetical protein